MLLHNGKLFSQNHSGFFSFSVNWAKPTIHRIFDTRWVFIYRVVFFLTHPCVLQILSIGPDEPRSKHFPMVVPAFVDPPYAVNLLFSVVEHHALFILRTRYNLILSVFHGVLPRLFVDIRLSTHIVKWIDAVSGRCGFWNLEMVTGSVTHFVLNLNK